MTPSTQCFICSFALQLWVANTFLKMLQAVTPSLAHRENCVRWTFFARLQLFLEDGFRPAVTNQNANLKCKCNRGAFWSEPNGAERESERKSGELNLDVSELVVVNVFMSARSCFSFRLVRRESIHHERTIMKCNEGVRTFSPLWCSLWWCRCCLCPAS